MTPHPSWVWFEGRPELRRKLRAWLLERERRWRGLRRIALRTFLLAVISVREFRRSLVFERAASLAFVSILTLIPAGVLFVSFAGMLGGGDRVIAWAEQSLLPKATPEFQQQVQGWLHENLSRDAFRAAGSGLVNVLSIFGLLSAAALLLTVSERVFNHIWHVRTQRPWLQRMVAFWVIVTTSPLVISGSLALEQVLLASDSWLGQLCADSPWMQALIGFALPLGATFLGLAILFALLPNTHVRWRSAALGAFIAALTWQLTKSAFYLYIVQSASLTSFYGQLASVPLFLIWVYLSWLILLGGANLAFCHQNLFGLMREERHGVEFPVHSRMRLGLALLVRRRELFAGRDEELSFDEEAGELAVPMEQLLDVARSLVRIGDLVEDRERAERFVLARSPERIELAAVLGELLDEQFPGERAASESATAADRAHAEAWRGYLEALRERTLATIDRG
ncbi:MAG: YihY family inner membrane protein [Planctomycetes bacterium]|nr:YihY family inner membrane protein [Planctomycetota bacterium]